MSKNELTPKVSSKLEESKQRLVNVISTIKVFDMPHRKEILTELDSVLGFLSLAEIQDTFGIEERPNSVETKFKVGDIVVYLNGNTSGTYAKMGSTEAVMCKVVAITPRYELQEYPRTSVKANYGYVYGVAEKYIIDVPAMPYPVSAGNYVQSKRSQKVYKVEQVLPLLGKLKLANHGTGQAALQPAENYVVIEKKVMTIAQVEKALGLKTGTLVLEV